MITERTKDLLIKASQCFSEGYSPFNSDWLSANGVTLDECMALSETIGLVLKGFALSNKTSQSEIFIVGTTGGEISSGIARSAIQEVETRRRTARALKRWK